MSETERVPIRDAAQRLGISTDTVRRRLKSGELNGERQETPQGFIWLVELPEIVARVIDSDVDTGVPVHSPNELEREEEVILRERVTGLERLVTELQTDRDAWQAQAQRADEANREMRILVQQAQALSRALPAPESTPELNEARTNIHEEMHRQGLWQRLREYLSRS
jgi:hypothetical protein